MSDDDMIRRGDALDAMCKGPRTVQERIDAIRALPAVQVGVRPLDWLPNSDYRPYGLIARDHSGFWTVHRSDGVETFEWADPYGKTTGGFETTDLAIASLEKERAARIRSTLILHEGGP